jgi:CheY-like chemotaxis protein
MVEPRVLVAGPAATWVVDAVVLLGARGARVAVADDAEDAWSRLSAEPFDFVVVADASLPGESGSALVRRARSANMAMPMLLVHRPDEPRCRAVPYPPLDVAHSLAADLSGTLGAWLTLSGALRRPSCEAPRTAERAAIDELQTLLPTLVDDAGTPRRPALDDELESADAPKRRAPRVGIAALSRPRLQRGTTPAPRERTSSGGLWRALNSIERSPRSEPAAAQA